MKPWVSNCLLIKIVQYAKKGLIQHSRYDQGCNVSILIKFPLQKETKGLATQNIRLLFICNERISIYNT